MMEALIGGAIFLGGCLIAVGVIFWLDKKPYLPEEDEHVTQCRAIDE